MSTDKIKQSSTEKKRKHKNKEHSPSKKRKHAAGAAPAASDDFLPDAISSSNNDERTTSKAHSKHVVAITEAAKSDPGSPFRLINATLYLPLSPISISSTHASASLIAEHLAPLLLTYYPPFQGIVLAYSNGSISSTPPTLGQVSTSHHNQDNPKPLTLALTANEYGVLYLYLTATFLVFSPQKGQVLEGWVNVQSEGFLGAIAYNLFSVGIERKRVPKSWKWIPPGADEDDTASVSSMSKTRRKGYVSATSGDEEDNGSNKLAFDSEKEHFTPLPNRASRQHINMNPNNDDSMGDELHSYDDDDDEDPNSTGYFQSISGHRVRGTIRFRVRDVDVIPGADPDRGFLSIEGTMLTPEEEARLEEEERMGPLPAHRQHDPTAMTGGRASQATQPVASHNDMEVAEIKLPETTKLEPKEEKRKEKKKSSKEKKSKLKSQD